MTLFMTYTHTIRYIMFYEKPNNCALGKFNKISGCGNYHDQVTETVHLQTVIQYKKMVS